FLYHFGAFGEAVPKGVTVDAGRPRPSIACFQHQPLFDGNQEQVGQPAVGLRAPRDQRDSSRGGRSHAARYSWIPATTSRRRILPATVGGSWPRASGAASPIPRCG